MAKRGRKKSFALKILGVFLFFNTIYQICTLRYKISRRHDVLSLFKKLIVKNIACSSGLFWAGELKLLVYYDVGIVVAAILDFMTEEHWGQ